MKPAEDHKLTESEPELSETEAELEEDTPRATFKPMAKKDQEPVTPEDFPFKTSNLSSEETTLDDLAQEPIPAGSSFTPRVEDAPNPYMREPLPPLGAHPVQNSVYSSQKRGSPTSWVQLLILALVVLGVVGATVYLLKGGSLTKSGKTSSPSVQSPLTQASATPAATPSPIDRSKYSLRVLNGTTKTGMAASVSAKLKTLGYNIDKTANATNSAFEQTQIRVKDGLDILRAQLLTDLKPDFNGASSSALKSSDTADAEVILGTK